MIDAIKNMTDAIVGIMDGNVTGVWLYGSVVLDDFRLGWSDIDVIAFTKQNILPNYALKLLIHKDYINILDKSMPILIIDNLLTDDLATLSFISLYKLSPQLIVLSSVSL